MSYVLPQVQVFQQFSALPTEVVENQNTFVFGPHYELLRYTQSDEKPLTALGAYDKTQDTTYGYPNKPSGSSIDTDYAKLFGESIWLKYFTINASATNPLVVVSSGERNKLRAAPRITDGGNAMSGAVTYAVGGYHSGMVSLPEAYYLMPQATFSLGAAVGVFDYITTENIEGSVDVPADATTAGVTVEGPDGIVFDFDNPDTVKSNLVVKIASAGGAYFTVGIKADQLKTHAEAAVAAAPYVISVTDAADSSGTSWTAGTKTLDIQYDDTNADESLFTVWAAILAADPDVAVYFDVSPIVGSGLEFASLATDQDAVDMVGVSANTVTDVIKLVVYENTFVFKTANGVSRTPSLYKDIEIGDKLVYQVTPASTGVPVEAETTVVGLEADYNRPTASAPAAGAGNQAALGGTDLTSGAAVVAAGPDNQITLDFDYAATKAYTLFAGETTREGNLTLGVLQESITLTVTKAGLAGVAQMSAVSSSGAYSALALPVEAVGVNDGQVYIGDGVYIDFVADTGNPTGNFLVGDQYIVGPVVSPYAVPAAPALTGIYGGQTDTVYTALVTRGGKFDREVAAHPGLTATANALLVPSLASWTGGDVDDEYVLECTTGGNLTTSVFKLTSRRGDNITGITFPGFTVSNAVIVGASGLKLHMDEDGGTPTFTAGEYFIVVVKASRPKVQITDSAGGDQESSVIVDNGVPTALGLNGLILTFPANTNDGLVLGDRYTVTATASAAGAVQTLVLEDEVTSDVTAGVDIDGNINQDPDIVTADVMLVVSSQEIPAEDRDPLAVPGDLNWTPAAVDVTVTEAIRLQNAAIVDGLGDQPYLEVYKMDMFLEYRALLQSYATAITSMTDVSEVTALGKEDPDNPLRLAVQIALENSDGTTVYFAALPSDDTAGWLSVLDKASVTDKVYAFTPLTHDKAVHNLVQAHVDAMSTETNKRWRRAFVGRDMPSETEAVSSTIHPLGNDYQATVSDDPRTGGTQYTRVEFSEDAQLISRVQVGDTVRLQFSVDAWGNTSYTTDKVAEVDSNTVMYLESGLSAAIGSAQRTEVIHTLTTAEIADAVATLSAAYADQRICHVFPGRLGRNGVYIDAMFGAAAIAGLVSSVPPQQGLTNVELIGFDDVPLTYSTFSQDQLDDMAELGTMIIMQETQGGEVFVRHQLTTAASDGNLQTAELSIVKNLDSISYYMAGRLKQFIGKYNVTSDLITVIETSIQDGLEYLGSRTEVGLLGPQVNLDNTRIRTVEQHPTLKDRILAVVELDLPAPLNVIELYLVI